MDIFMAVHFAWTGYVFRMNRSLVAVFTLASLALAPNAFCADAKAELDTLIGKITTQLKAEKKTEADLAPDFKEFDDLLAEHKGEKTEEVANILFMKAMLYAQVLQNTAKATEGLQQLKTEFPDSSFAKKVDPIVASLAKQEEANRIQRSLAIGTDFPDFQETDLDGKPLSPASEKGKVVLIDFWATWCGPCVGELPNVQKVYGEYHDKGFDIIGVSLDQDKDKLTSFIKEKQMPWPQYFDGKGWGNKVSTTYGINSIPATYLLGKDGKIIAKGLRGDDLEAAVKEAVTAN